MLFVVNHCKETFPKCAKYIAKRIQSRNYSNPYHNVLKLSERGLLKNKFPENCSEFDAKLEIGKLTAYCGFDPTADSLHIGNLVPLISLLHFQRGGHQPIALVGSVTASIGDPTGHRKDRPVIPLEEIESNTIAINRQIKYIFSNHEKYFWHDQPNRKLPPLILLDNKAWVKDVTIKEFLMTIGSTVRMNTLLGTKAIKERLQEDEMSPSLTEFLYQVFQAYDWLHLFENYGCSVQIGGIDQLGNISVGHEIIKRKLNKSVTGMLTELITNDFRTKLGKTAGNAVWLNADKTSPFYFYQYLLRSEDSQVEERLKIFTFMPLANIENIMEIQKADPKRQSAHKKLAEKATLLVHGEEGLLTAKRATMLLYGNDVSVLADMDEKEVFQLFGDAIVTNLQFSVGMTILDCCIALKCFTSKVEAETIISDGGLYINMSKVTTPLLIVIPGAHILPNGLTLIKVGKRHYYIIRWIS